MVMEGHDAPEYQRMVNGADLVTPDGVPLVWALKTLGIEGATRVYGPELTLRLLSVAARSGVPVGLYGGGSPGSLERLVLAIQKRIPGIRIAYAYSPPFRPLTVEEDEEIVRNLIESGVRILFVGLGCPKQERWMHDHRGRVPSVMLGVGAAFDFVAGTKRQAPAMLQKMGLEWLFRFACEPRRLWRRYLVHNPRYLWFFLLRSY
jgi:N-acetylglucosaminyldiphosphoundecaprenol N-acetyl-beta-D-mannosaminyltransferase